MRACAARKKVFYFILRSQISCDVNYNITPD
jgi:hypothetical protein